MQEKPQSPGLIMSEEAIERLHPYILREIIAHQRKLEDYCSQPIVNLREAQNRIDQRRSLSRQAQHQLAGSKFSF